VVGASQWAGVNEGKAVQGKMGRMLEVAGGAWGCSGAGGAVRSAQVGRHACRTWRWVSAGSASRCLSWSGLQQKVLSCFLLCMAFSIQVFLPFLCAM